MRFYETVEIDKDAEDLMDLIFKENPGIVIHWIRENTDKIIEWKQWNENHMNDFLKEIHKIRVGIEEEK